jgi:hypothetical protein
VGGGGAKATEKKSLSNQIMKYTKRFLEAIVIHTNKIALIILFLAAIYTIDLLHTGYFLLFLIFCLLGRQNTQKLWVLLLIYSGIVILNLYLFQVLALYFDISISYTLMHIGLSKTKRLLLFYYKEHLVLLFILFLQSALYETSKYKKYVAALAESEEENLEDNNIHTSGDKSNQLHVHEFEEEKTISEESQMISKNEGSRPTVQRIKKKSKIRTDLFTSFYIQYGLWLCYVCLLIVGFLPPPNVSSLIYLLFLTTFIILTLLYNDEKKV